MKHSLTDSKAGLQVGESEQIRARARRCVRLSVSIIHDAVATGSDFT